MSTPPSPSSPAHRPPDPHLPTAEHVVFGTGPVGLALAEALVDHGGSVRVVNRSGRAPAPAGVEVVGGDAADPAFAASAARGARVVYQVLAPAYHRWAEEFPGLQAGVLAAAEAAGARLVVLENVYAYGAPRGGTPFTEDSPFRTHTRKGAVRAAMTAELLAAADAGRVELAIGRASNYFGPRGGAQALNLGDQAMLAALTGGRAQVVGDPDQPHTYTFLPDIARGLAALGTHPAAAGRVWHLPNDPHTRTTRELLDLTYRLAGHRRGAGGARITRVRPAMLRALGLLKPPVREIAEMLYEFEQPFVVDSRRIAEELGVAATPAEQALAATLDTYR